MTLDTLLGRIDPAHAKKDDRRGSIAMVVMLICLLAGFALMLLVIGIRCWPADGSDTSPFSTGAIICGLFVVAICGGVAYDIICKRNANLVRLSPDQKSRLLTYLDSLPTEEAAPIRAPLSQSLVDGGIHFYQFEAIEEFVKERLATQEEDQFRTQLLKGT